MESGLLERVHELMKDINLLEERVRKFTGICIPLEPTGKVNEIPPPLIESRDCVEFCIDRIVWINETFLNEVVYKVIDQAGVSGQQDCGCASKPPSIRR